MLVSLTAACVLAAAQAFAPLVSDSVGLFEQDLYTLLGRERGKVGSCNPNRGKDGKIFSYDCGPFQINTIHGPMFGALFGLGPQDAMDRIRDNGCLNAYSAAYLYVRARQEAGGDRREGLGRYHSRTQRFKEIYQLGLDEVRRRLFGRGGLR